MVLNWYAVKIFTEKQKYIVQNYTKLYDTWLFNAVHICYSHLDIVSSD